MARLFSTLPVAMDMEQLLNYYLNIMLMSASVGMYVCIDCTFNGKYIYLSQNGWTPLMRASFEGHADIVQTLIEAQAQINRHNEVAMLSLP